jgi:hypothetical protein
MTPPRAVSFLTGSGVVSDGSYKEEPLIEPLDPPATPEQAREPGKVVAAAPSRGINRRENRAATEHTRDTSTIRPPVPESAFASEDEEAWTLAAWRRHPKKQGDKSEAYACLQSVYRDPEKRSVFDENHPRWCQTQQWRKENYRYCPRIPAFIQSEQYIDPPTEGERYSNDGYYEVPEL